MSMSIEYDVPGVHANCVHIGWYIYTGRGKGGYHHRLVGLVWHILYNCTCNRPVYVLPSNACLYTATITTPPTHAPSHPPPNLKLIPPLGRHLRTRQRAMRHMLVRRQQNLRVQMHTRMDPQPHGPPNRLGHLPLVHRPQPIQPALLDPSKRRHVFRDERKVLLPPPLSAPTPQPYPQKTYPIVIQRVKPHLIHKVPRQRIPARVPSRVPPPPLRRRPEVPRRVHRPARPRAPVAAGVGFALLRGGDVGERGALLFRVGELLLVGRRGGNEGADEFLRVVVVEEAGGGGDVADYGGRGLVWVWVGEGGDVRPPPVRGAVVETRRVEGRRAEGSQRRRREVMVVVVVGGARCEGRRRGGW